MSITILKSKIHRAKVTHSDLNYEGSILLDSNLMEAANILEYEKVDIWNINNGERFTTYAVKGDEGSSIVCVNGAAARLVTVGDLIIIATFVSMNPLDAKEYKPKIVLLNDGNQVRNY